MLNILGENHRFCDGIPRRSVLKVGGLGLGGLSLPTLLQAESQSRQPKRHKSVIMVFLPGGPSHMDIWDLKSEAPKEIRGEFQPIQTSVPGIEICEHLPKLAQRMHDFTLIRSLVGAINEHRSEICFSGHTYQDFQAKGHPSLGSAASKVLGPVHAGVPPFISLCHATPNGWKDPGRAGFLGAAHNPFQPAGEDKANMVLKGVTLDRLSDRSRLRNSFDRLRRDVDSSGVMTSVDQYTQQALEVLTSSRLLQALDIESEPSRVRDSYGPLSTDPVDDGAPMSHADFLLARRLVEAGARCVTISFGRWDTHSCRKAGDLAYKNNFMQLKEYMPKLEQCLLALVDDLKERGLKDDVALVVWGEMGRTPRVNGNGGRDHWPHVSSCVVAGGGMQMGQVIGSTNRLAEVAKDRPVHYQEVFATLYRHLGIDVSSVKIPDHNGRPQYLLSKHREPIRELI